MSDKRAIVEKLLSKHYSRGGLQRTSDGWLIRCPWHSPDRNPSCNVYFSGVFHCWRCKTKTPLEGFMAIGVPEAEAKEHFGNEDETVPDKPQKLPSLDDMDTEAVPEKEEEVFEVVSDELWPQRWAFRDLTAAVFQPEHPIFDMVNPRLVKLARKTHDGKRKLEGLPRLALSFPSNHDIKLYLRLSSTQDRKVINGVGVGSKFDPDSIPFGLTGWKLPDTCKALVLVEGPYDWLRLKFNIWQLGLWDVVEAGALLGTNQWDSFLTKFKLHLSQQIMVNGRMIVTAFDNDAAGAECTEQALKDLIERRDVLMPENKVKVFNYFPVHDPGDLGLEGARTGFEELGLL
jgi:hypothetical protein